MRSKTYTDEQIIEAVKSNQSIRQVLKVLGLALAGGSYQTIHKAIKRLGLDISHFTGKSSNKGKNLSRRRETEDYLSNQFPIQSWKLKNRLIKDKLLFYKCSSCTLSTWLNGPIPLELDHIDGNHMNNNLSNLRLLCPNCHALTPTHAGKNKGKGKYK